MESLTRVCPKNTHQKVLKETADSGQRTADSNPRTTDHRPQTAVVGRRSSRVGSQFFLVFTRRLLSVACGLLFVVCGLSLSGCGPKYTYPADSVPPSIEKISREEYKLNVISRTVGRTVVAVYYVDDILDKNGQIPKDVHEKMGQIMQVVTRVSLSTDLGVDFCEVVIRDRTHLNELTITRSLDDSKRANSDAIGVEESINRTIFAQGKYQLSPEGEKEFSPKEVKIEDFLAEQIAQRVRFSLAKDAKESSGEEGAGQQSLVLVDGMFNRSGDGNKFRFSVLSLKPEEPQESIRQLLRTANEVIGAYHIESFDSIEILDYLNRQKLDIKKQILTDLREKRITEQAVLDRYLTESQTIQEAFKLFGFNLSESADATDSPPLVPAAP